MQEFKPCFTNYFCLLYLNSSLMVFVLEKKNCLEKHIREYRYPGYH